MNTQDIALKNCVYMMHIVSIHSPNATKVSDDIARISIKDRQTPYHWLFLTTVQNLKHYIDSNV